MMDSLQTWFPEKIRTVRSNNAHNVSSFIEQDWLDVDQICTDENVSQDIQELELLIKVVSDSLASSRQIIIFCESKKVVDRVCDALRQAEIKNMPYYSDLPVQGKSMILMLFQTDRLPVLVSNSLAQRGLDSIGVQHVIQYEFPKTTVDWFQRVGRVGRMGQRGGKVTNFIRSGDKEMARTIAKSLQEGNEWDDILSTKSMRKRRN